MRRQRPSGICAGWRTWLAVLAQPLRDEAFEITLRHRIMPSAAASRTNSSKLRPGTRMRDRPG